MIGFNALGRMGRLANQMFQYASLKGIARNTGVDFCVPYHEEAVNDGIGNMLRTEIFDSFDLQVNVGLLNKGHAPVVQERFFHFDEELFRMCPDHVDIRGYFQTEKYFKHIEDEIRKDFEWRDDVKKLCQDMFDSIGGKAISLHIRRTDHLIKPTYHPVLPLSYYEEALSKFPSDLPVIVFSDEPAWCHEQKFFEDDRFLISDSGDNITDMCLMSMCQYQIMANSTYSWWGAWLSNSQDVIAPRLWFGPDGQDPKDVYVDRWEYLDV